MRGHEVVDYLVKEAGFSVEDLAHVSNAISDIFTEGTYGEKIAAEYGVEIANEAYEVVEALVKEAGLDTADLLEVRDVLNETIKEALDREKALAVLREMKRKGLGLKTKGGKLTSTARKMLREGGAYNDAASVFKTPITQRRGAREVYNLGKQQVRERATKTVRQLQSKAKRNAAAGLLAGTALGAGAAEGVRRIAAARKAAQIAAAKRKLLTRAGLGAAGLGALGAGAYAYNNK